MSDKTTTTSDGGELFPAANFDDPKLALPPIDGKRINQIRVRFSGSVTLDRTNPEHVAWFRDTLKLGAEIDLGRLSGVIQQKPSRQAATKDGYAGDVAQTAVVKIHTIGGFAGGAASEAGDGEA